MFKNNAVFCCAFRPVRAFFAGFCRRLVLSLKTWLTYQAHKGLFFGVLGGFFALPVPMVDHFRHKLEKLFARPGTVQDAVFLQDKPDDDNDGIKFLCSEFLFKLCAVVYGVDALFLSAHVLPLLSKIFYCGGGQLLLGFSLDGLWMLIALAFGIAAGLAVSPHILKRLMERDMGAVMYMVLGMMVGSLYAIVVGPTTLKVPQPAMTLADFSIVWFIIGAAAVLALSAFKSRAAHRKVLSAQ